MSSAHGVSRGGVALYVQHDKASSSTKEKETKEPSVYKLLVHALVT